MAISDNTRFVKDRRPVMGSPTHARRRDDRPKIILRLAPRPKIILRIPKRPKIILRIPSPKKLQAERRMKIKAEQQELNDEEVKKIDQMTRELVLEAEANGTDRVMNIESVEE